jgi:hypothetical protein
MAAPTGKAPLDALLAALRDGHGGVVRAAVGALLDGPERKLIARAMGLAGGLGPSAVEALEEAVEAEAQRVAAGAATAALVCFPALMPSAAVGRLPVAAVAASLRRHLAPGESLAILDGWIGVESLVLLDPFGYRRLAHRLAAAAAGGQAAVPVAAGDFPAAAEQGVDFFTEAGASERLVVRCAVGALLSQWGPADGGAVGRLVAGTATEDDIGAVADSFAEGLGGQARLALPPGQPFAAASDAIAATVTMGLDCRYIAAAECHGRKPVTHFCLSGDTLHVVLVDGDEVVDRLRVCLIGLDPEEISDIVAEQSSGVVQHDRPGTLPSVRRGSIH